jgi:transcriptional regulator with XRE-family HTH domain/tetratricopeptide (TPR) repeat protein
VTDSPGPYRSPGESLRRRRLAAGLSQEALAELAGISPRTLRGIERGAHRPYPDTIRRLSDALGLTLEERDALAAATLPGKPATPPAAARLGSRMVGREAELSRVESFLAGEGAPVLLVTGEPGIGKSRLLVELAGRAPAAGWVALWGGCHRRSAREPYPPLPAALAGHLAELAPGRRRAALAGCDRLVRLLPELAGEVEPPPEGALPPEQERRLLFAATARFLGNVAGPGGTLLLLDDMQWTTADALDLLASVVRADGDAGRLRVVCAYRDTDVRPDDPLAALVADLAREGLATRMALDPLAATEAARLLDDLLGEAPPAGLRGPVIERTGGVPFFLVSYAQHLRAAGTQQLDVPWDLEESVRQRVAVLPTAARATVEAAAAAGGPVRRGILAEVVGAQPDEAYAALDEAEHARLLVATGRDEYQFAHDVIREAVEASIMAARRAELHGRLAGVLEKRYRGDLPIEALAYHYARSDDDARAAYYLVQAGDRALRQQAYAAAETSYREAVERLERLGRRLDASGALVALARTLRSAGRGYEEALEVLDRAADAYKAAGDAELLARTVVEIGTVHAVRSTLDEGIRRLEYECGAIEAAPDAPRAGLALLYLELAELRYRDGRLVEHHAAAERAADHARAAGDESLVAATELRLGVALLLIGRGEEGLAAIEEASGSAERVGEYAALATALNNAAAVLLLAGEVALARAYSGRAYAAGERAGDAVLLVSSSFYTGMAGIFVGEWDEARAAFELSRAHDAELGTSSDSCLPPLGLAYLSLHLGELDEGMPFAEDSARLAREYGSYAVRPYSDGLLAEYHLLAGRPAEARAVLLPLLALPRNLAMTPYAQLRLAWAQMELGAVAEAEEEIARALVASQTTGAPSDIVTGLWLQALLAMRQERLAEVEGALEKALALARSTPYVQGEARALEGLAALHLHRGEPERARSRLEEARDLYLRLDTPAQVARLEHSLAALPQLPRVW